MRAELRQGANDNRSYRVSFEKIASQLHDVFERIGITREIFEATPYTHLKLIQQLIRTEQLDGDLFWRI